MADKVQQKQEAEMECKSPNKFIIMDESVSDVSSERGLVRVDWYKTAVTLFPWFENIYVAMLKPKIDAIRESSERIPFSYDTVEKHSSNIRMIHGLFLMVYGGSWGLLTILVSFWTVYDVESVFRKLYGYKEGIEMEKMLSSLHQLWILVLLCYATWSIPLLSAITIAFMLEKYVTGTLINSEVMTILEERFPIVQIFGRWCPFVIQVSIRLGFIILYGLSHKFQPCLVMACVGYDRFYSSLPTGVRKQIHSVGGPLPLDGRAITLWVLAILCSLWQFLHGYEFSMLGLAVPVGFVMLERKIKCN